MRAPRRAAAVAAAAACALIGCGAPEPARRHEGGEPDVVRIWMVNLVRWEPGQERHVEFSIENPTNHAIAIAQPDPAGAQVDVFAGPEPNRVCGVAPAGRRPRGSRLVLGPGDRVSVRVGLEAACGQVPPGEYRFQLSYRAAEAEGGKAFAGTLPTQYGQVVVSGPPREANAASGERR